MPSPRSRAPALTAIVAATALATGCGVDTDPACSRSFLRYDNFGSPFIVNWCRACHSVELPPDMRQQAPLDINFDNLSDIRHWSLQIKRSTAERLTMPPAGGPSQAERQMLVEWLSCGAP